MNVPVLLLDSTVLVALTDGRLMVTAALSLAVACAELGGETRNWPG